jgi:glycosyltransferase involved in cell wall biosynthesis
MRVVHIAAGAGAMYCGACKRDAGLARGLAGLGHDVEVVPIYTPLRVDDIEPPNVGRVRMGGVNVYLQHRIPLLRHTPAFLDWFWDTPGVLAAASKFAVRTKAADVGAMAVQVLRGMRGTQRKAVNGLIAYLEAQPKPEVISLTNTLLSGMASEIHRRMDVPVVASVQGEDGFVKQMRDPYRARAIEVLRANAKALDLVLCPCEAYMERMESFLDVERSRMALVRPGIYAPAYRRPKGARPDGPPIVGFLGAVTFVKGMDLVVEAAGRLKAKGAPPIRILAAGSLLDKRYLKAVERRAHKLNLDGVFQYCGELDFAQKVQMLQTCDIVCLPSRAWECRAMAGLEALAAGCHLIAPNSGIFPELADATGNVTTFKSDDYRSLSDAIRQAVKGLPELGARGADAADAVTQRYSIEAMATDAQAALVKAKERYVVTRELREQRRAASEAATAEAESRTATP